MELICEKGSMRRNTSMLGDEEAVNFVANLPYEIILNIISRLPVSTLVKIKYVCRTFRIMLKDPSLLHLHFYRSSNSDLYLIFHCDNPVKNHLYYVGLSHYSDYSEAVNKIVIPPCLMMLKFETVGSCNGLLCLFSSVYDDALCIYNPFTKYFLELPKSKMYPNELSVTYGFGFSPNTKKYKVIKVTYYRKVLPQSRFFRVPRDSEVQILSLGEDTTWRNIGTMSYTIYQWPAQVSVNGRLHWTGWSCTYYPRRMLVSFDLEDEQFRHVQVPDQLKRCCYHVVALGDCLCAAVYCNYGAMDIWVMKDYGVEGSWVKEFKIGTYLPKELKEVDPGYKMSKFLKNGADLLGFYVF